MNNHATPPYQEAGEWLRKQREYWQITQAELAEQLGIREVSLIAAVEQGEIVLPAFLRDAVATIFCHSRADMAAHCEEWYGQRTALAA